MAVHLKVLDMCLKNSLYNISMESTKIMVFMCFAKVTNWHFWTKTMTNTFKNNHPLSSGSLGIVYLESEDFLLVSEYFMKNKRDSQTLYLEKTDDPRSANRMYPTEKSEIGRLSSTTRVKREPYRSVDSFDQTAI